MKDISGKKFGRLTAIKFVEKRGRIAHWLFSCECGRQKKINKYSVTEGITISCGCFHIERIKKRCVTHGLSRTKFHNTWFAIKQRCYYKKNNHYIYYGGRGIRIDWDSFLDFKKDMYESFLEHIKIYGASNTQIERIDNDQNYSKDNCKWATRIQQSRNKSNCLKLEMNGKTQSLAEWVEESKTKIRYKTVHDRIYNGWSLEKALTTPLR